MLYKIDNTTDIIYCDIEADKKKIYEVGCFYKKMELKTSSLTKVSNFIKLCSTNYLAGHNFIDFDLEKLKSTSVYGCIKNHEIIDTLPLSLLFFNEKTIHSLPKNYKSEDNFKNDPLEDSKITQKLFQQIEDKFLSLESDFKSILYSLLRDDKYFKSFFHYIQSKDTMVYLDDDELLQLVSVHYTNIINYKYLKKVIKSRPVELAYIISLLTPHTEIKSHPPKILYTYPDIVKIQQKLCFKIGVATKKIAEFSKEVFGFGDFREFKRLNAGVFDKPAISQKEIVEASLKDSSFLCILPTGGGKTFTFWLPAIYKASLYKSLTVVISPLQALIEDHIKSFNNNVANYKAVAISGFLSPLERSESIEQVVNGEADILYIAPESLRSNMIFNILKNRYIERFVIDEAHCLSTWGNDFRQDYYYICEYIKELCEKKNFQTNIPVSCFTATAKPSVVDDIKKYFYDGLGLRLDEYFAVPQRKNLIYKSIPSDAKHKYTQLQNILKSTDGATLIYIPSSTKKCDEIAQRLRDDTQRDVKAFHSKIETSEKMQILKDYIDDKIDIIVATTAFGMGVDKPNILNVIHYEVSESLENYAQEAGRGARDQNLEANCPILFDEDDLDKHFISLNRSKLTASEINSIFRVIKKSKSDTVIKTVFELAKEAGWDVEDNSFDYETKVKTALLELEREGYISRQRNRVNFFADSIAIESMNLLHEKLKDSKYNDDEKQRLVLVLQTILGRGKVSSVQVDELAYLLGYKNEDISLSINQLKDMEILGDSKDLSLEISKDSLSKFNKIQNIELHLFEYLKNSVANQIKIRELNDYLHNNGYIKKSEVELIKFIVKNWRDKSSFLFKRRNREHDLWYVEFLNLDNVAQRIKTKHEIANKLLKIFISDLSSRKKEKIEFSLKSVHKKLDKKYGIKEIDRVLLYLHHLNIVNLLDGRFISYSPMSIKKEQKIFFKRKYTEYKIRMLPHYKIKVESIHIMGEYAKRLQDDDYKAMQFLKDYFTISYDKFKKKYKLLKEKISRPITKKRFDKIFTNMSDEQKEIIEDKTTKAMMILAGPGSGKTKVLVHKIASLILTEDVKPEQFMMLTFSKTAKLEFKSRLNALIGSLSYDVEIQTFHSFALKLIARNIHGNEKILEQAISEATRQINEGSIALPFTSVLVLDEYQDINQVSFEFVKAIYDANNQDMRIIAVGDDDQCIMDFAGANVEFIERFEQEFAKDGDIDLFKRYELSSNFRSDKNIVDYTNTFAKLITNRYKEKDLYSVSSKDGMVAIYNYPNLKGSFVKAIVDLVKNENELKNIAILASTNDEVMQVYSLLQENGIGAKYIIDRDGFKLKNLAELFEFDKILQSCLVDKNSFKESDFEDALKVIEQKYKTSSRLQLLYKIVDRFISENDEYYLSYWLSYIDEIKLEDFDNHSRVVVSTMHKSKGMEFDSVFVLVHQNKKQDKNIRLYYVAMTRAKHNLYILRKGRGDILDKKEYLKYHLDTNIYDEEDSVFTYIMNLKDIYLGFNSQKYGHIDFFAGDRIDFNLRGCYVYMMCNNKSVGSLSKDFKEVLDKKLRSGFKIQSIIIDSVVMWYNQNESRFLKHPLCKIVMRR